MAFCSGLVALLSRQFYEQRGPTSSGSRSSGAACDTQTYTPPSDFNTSHAQDLKGFMSLTTTQPKTSRSFAMPFLHTGAHQAPC
eukprot:2266096-Amphidinium_carterae.1